MDHSFPDREYQHHGIHHEDSNRIFQPVAWGQIPPAMALPPPGDFHADQPVVGEPAIYGYRSADQIQTGEPRSRPLPTSQATLNTPSLGAPCHETESLSRYGMTEPLGLVGDPSASRLYRNTAQQHQRQTATIPNYSKIGRPDHENPAGYAQQGYCEQIPSPGYVEAAPGTTYFDWNHQLNHGLQPMTYLPQPPVFRQSDLSTVTSAGTEREGRPFDTRNGEEAEADERTSSVNEPYAQLIYRALMSQPSHSMTLQEIYRWILENSDKRSDNITGWKNSIRHNLSMNAAFRKLKHQPAGREKKKVAVWVLEPFAVTEGIKSTAQYRKNFVSKRASNAGDSSISRTGRRTSSTDNDEDDTYDEAPVAPESWDSHQMQTPNPWRHHSHSPTETQDYHSVSTDDTRNVFPPAQGIQPYLNYRGSAGSSGAGPMDLTYQDPIGRDIRYDL